MNHFNITKRFFLFVFIFIFFEILFSSDLTTTSSDYIIKNGKFEAVISQSNGMLESLKLQGSDFELAADYPNYSIFFPEFLYEWPDGQSSNFYDSFIDDINITTSAWMVNDLIIVRAFWNSGKINSQWTYFFEPDKSYFRAIIERTVIKTGIYSNFQQCTMYNPDMDNSFITNYQGQLELTCGDYSGRRPFVAPIKNNPNYIVTCAQHSLWTVFDYGTPTFFPTIGWSDNETRIHAGIIIPYTSPNQRETISYHGGGTTRQHPGFTEAQFNWFGKSDSESLYLREGTTFSMELYFYQNYGSIDSLFDFSEKLKSNHFQLSKPENYVAASWGGRTSATEIYYWRFPQVSSNYITSQELWQHKSFAIPRSQNGIADIHLFSINLVHRNDNQKIELTPIHGTTPLFDSLWTVENDSAYIGGMSWREQNFYTKLAYTAYPNKRHISVQGEIIQNGDTQGCNLIEFPLSSRTTELFIDPENFLFSFNAIDGVLDTISIGMTHITGIDSYFVKEDTLFLQIANPRFDKATFQFDLYPMIQKTFRYPHQTIEIDSQIPALYREYFVTTTGNSKISFLPSPKYYIFKDEKSENLRHFNLYALADFDTLRISLPDAMRPMIKIKSITGSENSAKYKIETNNQIMIFYPFAMQQLYSIYISNDEKIQVNNLSDSLLTGKLVSSSVYPNPSDGIVTIRVQTENNAFLDIEIYNLMGQQIFKSPTIFSSDSFQSINVDLSAYPSSLYFCKISSAETSHLIKLILIK